MIQQADPIVDPSTDRLTYEPGIYRNVDDATYRRIDAVSKSDLDKWCEPDRCIDERVALTGTAFHAAVLEPGVARERIVVCESRRNSKAWEGAVESQPDKWVLTRGEFDTLKGAIESVKSHPEAGRVRKLVGDSPEATEIVLVWRDESSGVLCKCKIDQDTGKTIIDWKTTGLYNVEESPIAVASYGYGDQAAHYSAGWLSVTGEVRPFAFIFVSKRKDKGHPVWVYRPSDAEMLAGQRSIRHKLALFARYNHDHPAVLPI